MLENVYIISYSRLQGVFMLVKGSTRHIISTCNDFSGIHKRVNQLQEKGNIELTFTDSAIDEIQRRNLNMSGVM